LIRRELEILEILVLELSRRMEIIKQRLTPVFRRRWFKIGEISSSFAR
jgi:hypothetical protein